MGESVALRRVQSRTRFHKAPWSSEPGAAINLGLRIQFKEKANSFSNKWNFQVPILHEIIHFLSH